MANIPEGAQLSEDGRWWWDGQQWQPVPEEDGNAGAGQGGDQTAGDDRAAARVAQGLPASLTDLTDEHRQAYLGQPTVEVHLVDADEVEVLAMQDTGSGSGETMA